MNTNNDQLIQLLEKFAERLDKLSKQLDRLENAGPFFLPVPPPNVSPGTPTPPLLGPGYTAPDIGDPPNGPTITCRHEIPGTPFGDEITICKHPDGGV